LFGKDYSGGLCKSFVWRDSDLWGEQSADIVLKQSSLKDLHVITLINEGERAKVPCFSLVEKAKRCLLL